MDFKNIVVENVTYKVVPLDPMSALRYGTKVMKSVGPAFMSATQGNIGDVLSAVSETELEAILQSAYAQTYTPKNECLGDPAVFNEWFTEYKSHLFVVGIQAVIALTRDFFPKQVVMKMQEKHSPA